MNAELLKALSQLSIGAICAVGLLGALYVIHSQNQVLSDLLERQTIALEEISKTYRGL